MAGSINPGINLNAASVPVSKYISNATHTGALQDQGSKVVKSELPKDTPPRIEAAQESSPAEGALLPGLHQEIQEDGSLVLAAESGVRLAMSSEGKIQTIDLPGEGQIQRQEDGGMVLFKGSGQAMAVEPFTKEDGSFGGYGFVRKDGTSVFLDLEKMAVGYIDSLGSVHQEIDASNGHRILINSSFKDPKTGEKSKLKSHLYVHPDGHAEHIDGYAKGLEVSAGKIKLTNPANHPHTIDLPVKLPGFESSQPEATPIPQTSSQAPLWETPPDRPMTHAVIPSMALFHRDEEGQLAVQLRTGVTLMHTKDRTVCVDPRSGERLPATAEKFTSSDGRSETVFKFQDSQGNDYQMFDDSMDFLVTSKDGKVRQHVLPDGTVLGVIQGEDRPYRFEITPKGEYKLDPGLMMQPSPSGQDVSVAYLPGAMGAQAPSVQLPYPIPGDQANAGQHLEVFGAVKYPQSGLILPGFEGPTQPVPQPPPQNPAQPAPQPPGPMSPPTAPVHNFEATYLPHPGMFQQPVEPGAMQRLKYMFTGNPMDLQPRGYQPSPPWMGGYPSYGTGYPQPGPMGYPGMSDPMAYPSMPTGYPTATMSYPSGPSYPNPHAPTPPNWTGAPPGQPGQMPGGSSMLDRMRAEYFQTEQMLNQQIMTNQWTTNMMIAGQTMHSAFNGMNMAMAMWPRNYFFNPFCFF